MSADQIAAYLEDIRARNSAFGEGAADVPCLLAALNAALALADEFAATPFPDDVPLTATQGHIEAAAIEATISSGQLFRQVITRELLKDR